MAKTTDTPTDPAADAAPTTDAAPTPAADAAPAPTVDETAITPEEATAIDEEQAAIVEVLEEATVFDPDVPREADPAVVEAAVIPADTAEGEAVVFDINGNPVATIPPGEGRVLGSGEFVKSK